jgi:3-oxoacyl-[acyl-carrier-protein] synthase-3
MKAVIRSIAYHLPEATVTSDDLAAEFPGWSAANIESKVGIRTRHVVANSECASDLAVAAAQKLFAHSSVKPTEVDFLLLCTQSPDYFLPTTACLVQERLGLSKQIGALDFNLGCSGFIYGLGLAKGLIETGQANCVLLITSETYSRFLHASDRSVRTIFGDAAAATLIGTDPGETEKIGPFIYGTDGKGAENLIVQAGGMRHRVPSGQTWIDDSGIPRNQANLYMNGPELFAFTMREVPGCIHRLLEKTGTGLEDYDLFVFHQANRYMLEHLRKGLRIAEHKFYVAMEHCGNTVSSTIPIALFHAEQEGKLAAGSRVMLVGFGVGYSWGATAVIWQGIGSDKEVAS